MIYSFILFFYLIFIYTSANSQLLFSGLKIHKYVMIYGYQHDKFRKNAIKQDVNNQSNVNQKKRKEV